MVDHAEPITAVNDAMIVATADNEINEIINENDERCVETGRAVRTIIF